jgi:TonB family protein
MSEATPAASAGVLLKGKLVRPDALRVEGAQTARVQWRRGEAAEKFYPPEARRKGLDGIVTVDLLINTEGYVVEAQVISESPGGEGFGLAALDLVKTYEYFNGFKRQVLMAVTVEFLP